MNKSSNRPQPKDPAATGTLIDWTDIGGFEGDVTDAELGLSLLNMAADKVGDLNTQLCRKTLHSLIYGASFILHHAIKNADNRVNAMYEKLKPGSTR